MINAPNKGQAIYASRPLQSILIVGCGIAGPVLASLLLCSTRSGPLPTITIVERNPTALGSGQNIDLRGIGKHIIRLLGLEDEVKASTTGEEGVKVVDAKNRVWAQFAADKTGEVETGTSDVEILRGRLAEILLNQCRRKSKEVQDNGGQGVEFIFGDSIEALDQDQTDNKVHVHFAERGRRTFDIVVGADGLHSKTRRLAFGHQQDDCIKSLHMRGAFLSTAKLPGDGEWRSWFHAPGGVSVMLRPSGTKERSTVLILMADVSNVLDKERDVAAQKEAVLKKLSGISWQEERLKKAVTEADDFYIDITAQTKLDSWSKGRVVLLGDAGYCASPFSGMGTTLALAGAYHLAGSLIENEHEAAFKRYEENMRPLVDKAQKLPPGMPHLIHPQTVWGVWFFRLLAAAMYWSGLIGLMFRFKGPPAQIKEPRRYNFKM
ncbi:putative oxidoreductase [Aureobasidium subglaciale]|nr:putative oxidoreductase [Aureobasidium subglaciale]